MAKEQFTISPTPNQDIEHLKRRMARAFRIYKYYAAIAASHELQRDYMQSRATASVRYQYSKRSRWLRTRLDYALAYIERLTAPAGGAE